MRPRTTGKTLWARKHRLLWASLLVGSGLSLVLALSVAMEWLIVGSPQGHWVYPYLRPFGVRSIRVWVIASAVAGGLLSFPDTVVQRREWLLVAMWVVVGIGLQALLRSLTPFTLERMFASDISNSFYGVTRQYSAVTVLQDFDRLRAGWPLHAQSNMPGKLILVYALEWFSTRPAVLAWLVVAVSNLGGVLLYLFVRDLFGDRLVALFSLVLYLFVPGKLYFFPLLNTVTPTLVLCCASLVLRWVRTSSRVYAALLGVALYGFIFFEPLALVMGLLFAALAGRALWRREIARRTLILQSGIVVLTFAVTYVTIRALLGFDLFDALGQVVADGIRFNDLDARPYWLWVRHNPLDFFFAVGLCQTLVFWVALADSLRGADHWQDRLARPMATIGLALAGVLLAIDLIGVNRGEVIRLWIFLACLFQIPTAYVCARLHSRAALTLVLATTLLQDVLGTSMIGFVRP